MQTTKELNPQVAIFAAMPSSPPRQVAQIEPKPGIHHPVTNYLNSLQSPTSRRGMQSELKHLSKLMSGGKCDEYSFPWCNLNYAHLNALKAKLLETYTFTTVNHKLAAVKGVLKAAWRMELINKDQLSRATDVPAAKGEKLPAGRSASREEITAIFAAIAADPRCCENIKLRDAAVLGAMFSVGAPRRTEVALLCLSDYDAASGQVEILHGKGNKQRKCYLPPSGRVALDAWVAVRGDVEGPLFAPISRGGNVLCDNGVPRSLSSTALWKIVTSRACQAGLEPLTPHDFRRTVAGDLLDQGVDLATVQAIMGHADPKTTASYDRRGEERKQAAADLLNVPSIQGARNER